MRSLRLSTAATNITCHARQLCCCGRLFTATLQRPIDQAPGHLPSQRTQALVAFAGRPLMGDISRQRQGGSPSERAVTSMVGVTSEATSDAADALSQVTLAGDLRCVCAFFCQLVRHLGLAGDCTDLAGRSTACIFSCVHPYILL